MGRIKAAEDGMLAIGKTFPYIGGNGLNKTAKSEYGRARE